MAGIALLLVTAVAASTLNLRGSDLALAEAAAMINALTAGVLGRVLLTRYGWVQAPKPRVPRSRRTPRNDPVIPKLPVLASLDAAEWRTRLPLKDLPSGYLDQTGQQVPTARLPRARKPEIVIREHPRGLELCLSDTEAIEHDLHVLTLAFEDIDTVSLRDRRLLIGLRNGETLGLTTPMNWGTDRMMRTVQELQLAGVRARAQH